MTDTLSRPAGARSPHRRPRRLGSRPGLLRAGLPAAAWALGAGLVVVAVPVLLVWAADSRSAAGVGAALRTVAAVWLAAHGATLDVPGGSVGLTPLGLLALPLLLLARAARHAAGQHEVRTLGDAARLAAGVAGPYALALAAVAGLSGTAELRPDAGQALLGASVVGLLGAGAGVLRGAGLGDRAAAALPGPLRRSAPLAAGALLALCGAGALLVAVQLAVHLPRARDLAAATTPGVVGGAGLLLLGVVLAGNAAVWGLSWLAGPGFAVGVGTSVGPFGVALGPVPALPVLGALPAGAPPAWAGLLALLVPVGAGVLLAVLARRRGAGLRDALLAAALVGAGAALLAGLSGGPVGGGALRDVGPSWAATGGAVTVEVLLGVALTEAAARVRARRRG